MPVVDSNQPDPRATQATTPRGEPVAEESRFLYASGDRPLPGFTIKRGIGRGGFGEVYYAVSDAGKEVALKLLCRHLDIELRGIQHCLNLKHPNLLMIYDVQRDPRGDTWVIMEYVRGLSLEQALANHPQGLPPDEALVWFHGMASGVGYLHSHGIVHRDLKPGNLFLEEGVVKVGDYGLAKYISCSRRSGQTQSVGTVHYMAPEVGRGRYGKEIDIYAMGIILYEMLTGRVPFDGESAGEILIKHLTEAPDLTRVPQRFHRAIARALEKNPDHRYHAVAEMLADLPPPLSAGMFLGPITTEQQNGRPTSPQKSRDDEIAFTPVLPNGAIPSVTPATAPEQEKKMEGLQAAVAVTGGEPDRGRKWFEHLSQPAALAVIGSSAAVLLLVAFSTSHAALAGLLGMASVLLGMLFLQGFRRRLTHRRSSQAVTRAKLVPPAERYPVAKPVAEPVAHGPVVVATPVPPPTREEAFRMEWRQMPLEAHVAELLGSMLAAVLVAAVVALVGYLILSFRGNLPSLLQAAWLYFTMTFGTWIVLILAKLWQGREGDVITRRFVMMIAGFLLGAIGFFLSEYLKVDLPFDPRWPNIHDWQLPAAFYREGQPMLPAMVASFGTLFLFVRWWQLADPLRPRRFGFWGVFGPGVAAFLASTLWVFPAQWLVIPAMGMGITLQLAAPWFMRSRFGGSSSICRTRR
ncbi:serine/threonine-protein kinase [Thermogutta sp.]|uniref:serine/threonine-protein kinase n=1 Tax=Thermogutta sp. TaxID=1962930 RepID=UPI003C7E4F69